MTEELSPLALDLLAGLSDATVSETFGYREDRAQAGSGLEAAAASPLAPRDVISAAGYDFIVRWETGGRAYYEGVIRGRPGWPGYSSGITIGCGYDLGFHRMADFEEDWDRRLPRSVVDRLAPALGFRTTEPDRPAKVARARALVASLSDIVIPWPVAIEQFDTSKLPKLVQELYRSLDNVELLHPHCRSALLSLVFNRGASFTASGPRYAEMRAIGDAMSEGTQRAFTRIPGLLRGMRRIWGPTSSLAERREGEARLFEAGLAETGLARGLAGGGTEVAHPSPAETHADVEASQTDVAEDFVEREGLEIPTTSAPVSWHPVDDEQPDYRHLDTRLTGTTAEITPEDIETLIAANDFVPKPGHIILALRGARLVGGDRREDVPSITITDQRPDHRDFRCVIGTYDPARRRFSAYQASTVPNALYVEKCHRDFRAGVPVDGLEGNILPTGCYTVTVGTHRAGSRGEIPGVLRLSTTPAGASRVVVLRSLEDGRYDRRDRYVAATPGDNIHPAQRSSGFSSAGCLTLPGLYAEGRHSGAWRDFRAAAGFDESTVGKQFSLLLLTGLDAIVAAALRGGDPAPLRRLRHGSQGAAVARLQAALGLAPDPSRLLGPVTRDALARAQSVRLGWADAIHSPEMDGLLGFGVFADGNEAAVGALPGATEDDVEPIVATLAEAPAGVPPFRLVAAFDGAPPSDVRIAATATARLGREVAAGPLFEPDPDLDRFRLLLVPGVERPERADLFDLAAALRDALGAASVEPDLGTDYFAAEPAPREPDAGLESSDLAGWCWAHPEDDKPSDRDWAMNHTRVREGWAMPPAAEGAARGRGILVFQPDTGVVPDHVELPPGLANDPRAGNFVEGGTDATDPRRGGSNPGHGTATASVVVSPEDGEMTGAAPEATLVPVRCIETVAVFDQSPVAQAIDHARRKGAHVITMSLGGVPSMALHAALRRAVAENVIVLAAAGNCVGEVVWPARYDAAIAVAGVNEAGKPWRGSSHGPDVDIAGPAEFVLRANGRDTSVPPRGASGGEGTSFATALIAGIAALWLAHHGRDRLIGFLPPGRRLQDMFRALLRHSAQPLPVLDPSEFGPGLVRADLLLDYDPARAFDGATEGPAAAAEPTDGLTSLLARTLGMAGQESAGIALLHDRQHLTEIACLALDQAQRGGQSRAYLEALPPAEMSIALRRRLGPRAEAFR